MKQCFVIMPITDSAPYSVGHFKRVYDYIIKPACEAAEFSPVRADDVHNTNHIAIDIVKKVIESDMAICDLSGRNPNVLYELGIRQAFNKPVTLIKDSITERIFDIQGFRDVQYDESLRIDNVQAAINDLAQTLINTYRDHEGEVNSLVSLLGINAAELKNVQVSPDTEIILNAISSFGDRLSDIEKATKINEPLLPPEPIITNEKGAIFTKLLKNEQVNTGDVLWHPKFGLGEVTQVRPSGKETVLSISFFAGDKKEILQSYALLQKRRDYQRAINEA